MKLDTIQRQSKYQYLRKQGFSDIYAQDYSGHFKDIKAYTYLNGENHRSKDISPIIIFSSVNLKNELLAFLGYP